MWGTALDHFVGLTNRLQMIGEARKIHIAVTVWEKAAGGDDEDSASDMIPDLQGGIKNRLAGMFDVSVYHTTRTVPDESEPENPGQTEFRCLTVPFGNRKQAKCRWKRILGDGEDQKIVQALDPIEKLDISNWIDRIRLGCKQLLEIRKVGATPPAEATPAPAPAPAPDPAPAPAPAAPTADAATVAANQAAAAELAASSEATASREDLLAICREWVNGARKKYAEKEAEIVAFVLELSASLGVEKLGQLQTVEQVQQAIDAMDKFETEQLAT